MTEQEPNQEVVDHSAAAELVEVFLLSVRRN